MRIIAIVLFGYILVSCKPEYLKEDELRLYLSNTEHNLSQEVKVNNLKVQLTFNPTDLLVAQEAGSKTDAVHVAELRKKYGSHCYFVLALSNNNREAIQSGTMPQGQFNELLQTISFRMGDYVNLTTAKQDTIPVADFMYARTFGMGTSNDILLAFNKSKITDQQWIQINISEFGLSLGRQSFRFNCNDLDQVPKIDFSNRFQ